MYAHKTKEKCCCHDLYGVMVHKGFINSFRFDVHQFAERSRLQCTQVQDRLQLKHLLVAVKAHPTLAVLAAEMTDLVDHACK